MHASYFGSSDRPLLGLYSPPSCRVPRDAAVVLCHPAPQEYMRSYWALRRLAARLVDDGFHVFRFDYYGTGDSAGESTGATLADWRDDIAGAVDEVRDVSGVRRVSVVGFRLGATLAAQTKLRVHDLVLWDPVISGKLYLAELRERHERQLAHNLQTPRLPRRGPVCELLGHALPPALQEELESMELLWPLPATPARLLVVVAQRREEHARLLAAAPCPASLEVAACEQTGDEPFLMWPSAERRISELLAGAVA